MRPVPLRLLAPLLLAASLGAPASLRAQSDILLQLRSGTPLGDRMRVDSAGGMVLLGQLGAGIIPATGGGGARLVWYPGHAAFRSGSVDGAQWDDANVAYYSWAGGQNTTATGSYSFAFGSASTSSGLYSVALGNTSTATGQAAVAIGDNASACGTRTVAIGGFAHSGDLTSAGTCQGTALSGSVAIGTRTTASGSYSTAMGYRATTAGHVGAFVVGDFFATDSVAASADNQLTMRMAGGYRFFSNAALTTGCFIAASGITMSCSSTRAIKHGFLDVDGESLLGHLAAMPISTWLVNGDSSNALHMGPVAEDFRAAFGLGADDRTVGLSDLSGVALAAAKALEVRTRELAEKTAKIEAMEQELADLRARLTRLEGAKRGP